MTNSHLRTGVKQAPEMSCISGIPWTINNAQHSIPIIPLFFCGSFHRQEITGPEKIKSGDSMSSLMAIPDVLLECSSLNLLSSILCAC